MRLNVLFPALAVVTAGWCVAPDAVEAQQLPLIQGSRVRIQAASLVAPLVANFLEQRHDTLVFIEEGTGRGIWSFPISQIERLETTAGEAGRNQNQVKKGALWGAGAGAVVGIMFAATARPSQEGKTYDRLSTGLIGAAVGAGIGAFIGARARSERWVNVPLPRQLSLVPDLRGGFRLTIGAR